jgi:hypothetical protein
MMKVQTCFVMLCSLLGLLGWAAVTIATVPCSLRQVVVVVVHPPRQVMVAVVHLQPRVAVAAVERRRERVDPLAAESRRSRPKCRGSWEIRTGSTARVSSMIRRRRRALRGRGAVPVTPSSVTFKCACPMRASAGHATK